MKKVAARKSAARGRSAGPKPPKKPVRPVAKKAAGKASAKRARAARGGFTAADLMSRDVLTVHPGTPVSEVSAMLKLHNIKGAPVVERSGELVGIITEDDLVFGQLGISDEEREMMAGSGNRRQPEVSVIRRVAEIMTRNPISAEETTPIEELCRLMSRLKIHRIPIVTDGRVVGIVTTIDICRILAEGEARLVRT